MRILLSLLAILVIGQINAQDTQKLYTWNDHINTFTNSETSLNSLVEDVTTEHTSRSSNQIVSRKELTKNIFLIEGHCKSMVRQAVNAKQTTADMLTKYMLYEWELEEQMKKEKGAGYYEFTQNDLVVLSNISNNISILKDKIKANNYVVNYGLPNADKNLEMIQEFNKLYNKFVSTLENSYTAL